MPLTGWHITRFYCTNKKLYKLLFIALVSLQEERQSNGEGEGRGSGKERREFDDGMEEGGVGRIRGEVNEGRN